MVHVGSGLWNKRSLQVPRLVQAAISEGQAIVVGDGKGVWDNGTSTTEA
jgi:hypothetical protein